MNEWRTPLQNSTTEASGPNLSKKEGRNPERPSPGNSQHPPRTEVFVISWDCEAAKIKSRTYCPLRIFILIPPLGLALTWHADIKAASKAEKTTGTQISSSPPSRLAWPTPSFSPPPPFPSSLCLSDSLSLRVAERLRAWLPSHYLDQRLGSNTLAMASQGSFNLPKPQVPHV